MEKQQLQHSKYEQLITRLLKNEASLFGATVNLRNSGDFENLAETAELGFSLRGSRFGISSTAMRHRRLSHQNTLKRLSIVAKHSALREAEKDEGQASSLPPGNLLKHAVLSLLSLTFRSAKEAEKEPTEKEPETKLQLDEV
jgi:hypothetical protein